MNFDIYCDESRPDLLGSRNPQARFLVIGSLWLPRDYREKFKASIHALRDRHRVGGEFKWQKVSPSRSSFYRELIDWFIEQELNLRFRCIAVDHDKVDLKLHHDDDQELGFYKFYYQLLHHWITDFNDYSVFVDYKRNRRGDRLHVLQRCLDRSNLASIVTNVQAVRSEESVLIQLADVLTGAAAYRLNGQINPDSAKAEVMGRLEFHLNRPIAHTPRTQKKFNVFQIDLGGGW